MVEVKAEVSKEKEGTVVNIKYEGAGVEIVEETIAVIKGLMGDIRKEAKPLYPIILAEMASDPSILFGEDEEVDGELQSFKKWKEATLKKGVN